MFGIKQNKNEWYEGLHYSYNPDQDQTRKEIKRLIDAATFVNDEDYDTEGYFTIPTKVRYKQYVQRRTRGEYAQNARNTSGFKEIEVSRDYSIKVNDRFKTMDLSDDAQGYKIEEIDTKRNTYKTKATLILPGLYDEYNNTKILRLR